MTNNEAYIEYQKMLVQLHRLIADNLGDSKEAQELNEDMEIPELELTEQDIVRLNSLSGDLQEYFSQCRKK